MAAQRTVLASLLERPEAEQKLGPYQLKKQLGRGGFAPVHLAVESYGGTELRWVAIKLFALDGLSEGEGSERSTQARITRERIVEEARALCRVEHPNIVRFFTLVTDPSDCILGLVMEHLLGSSFDKILAERLKTRERPMTIPEVLTLGGVLASALTVVHRAGLVHRDVKPANVIDASGTPKLIDFGVATARRAAPRSTDAVRPEMPVSRPLPAEAVTAVDASSPTMEAGATPSGRLSASLDGSTPTVTMQGDGEADFVTAGTLGYMDPATFDRPATASSDLYSLGAMLFECLTGATPAAAAARMAGDSGLKADVVNGRARAPSLRAVLADAPDELVRLIDSMLDPDPAARPRSAEAVAWDLERLRLSAAGRSHDLPSAEIGPFRGLGRFEGEDRGVYFGRTAETAAGLEILRSRGVLALVGPAGSGKSSLGRAGILPAIQDGALGPQPKNWDIAVATPGPNPWKAVLQALQPVLGQEQPSGADALVQALAAHVQRSERGVALMIDQLEELVVLSCSEERDAVVDLIARLGERPLPGIRCIVAGRRDLLGAVLGLAGLGRVLPKGMLLVNPLDVAAWADVVDQALAAYGYRMENEKVRAQLLSQLEETAEAMPLVQFALTELWTRRDVQNKLITRKALESIGGIPGALEAHAERVYQEATALGPDVDSCVRNVLLSVTTAQGTRSLRPRAEAIAAGGHDRAEAVVGQLERGRLLANEPQGLTIAHDSLLVHWTRLASWLSEARKDRLLAEEVERDALPWAKDRGADRIWRGRRLRTALDLLSSSTVRLSDSAQEFLRTGRRRELARLVLIGGCVAAVAAGAVAGTAVYAVRQKQARMQVELALQEARRAEQIAHDETEKANKAKQELEITLARVDVLAKDYETRLRDLEKRVKEARSAAELKDIQEALGKCAEPIVLLAVVGKNAKPDIHLPWLEQAVLALRTDVPGSAALRASFFRAPLKDKTGIVATCPSGEDCAWLAKQLKTMIPGQAPQGACRPDRLGIVGPLEPQEMHWALPAKDETIMKCARIQACFKLVRAGDESDPGLECQKNPSKFKLSCVGDSHPSCKPMLDCLGL